MIRQLSRRRAGARLSRWRRAAALGIVGFAALVAVAGCAASSEDSATSGSAPNVVAPEVKGDTADEAGGDTASGSGGGTASGGSAQAPTKVDTQRRSIIYTGSMTVRTDNVNTAANGAVDLATGVGGYVGGDKRSANGDEAEAQLVLRVPADRFTATLDALAKLGTEESRAIATDDVTEAVVDVDARIVSQQASVARVRALLARANTIGEVVSIESELTRREADLASLQARKRNLADQVSLSTITVNLHNTVTPTPISDEPETGFVAGLKSGWHAFVVSVKVVLTIIGALLPFAVAIGVPLALVIWLVRRRRPTPPPTSPI